MKRNFLLSEKKFKDFGSKDECVGMYCVFRYALLSGDYFSNVVKNVKLFPYDLEISLTKKDRTYSISSCSEDLDEKRDFSFKNCGLEELSLLYSLLIGLIETKNLKFLYLLSQLEVGLIAINYLFFLELETNSSFIFSDKKLSHFFSALECSLKVEDNFCITDKYGNVLSYPFSVSKSRFDPLIEVTEIDFSKGFLI